MQRPTIKAKHGPEYKIQKAIINFLMLRGWYVKETHGNMYQQGFPDLYVCKRKYGSRWLEVKNPVKYKFTPAQLISFPRMSSEGIGIWILTAATEVEYAKLFKPANWWTFLHISNENR